MNKLISTITLTLLVTASAYAAPAKRAMPTKKSNAPAMENIRRETTHANAYQGTFARAYGMAGCGLGSIVVGNHGGQIWAGTTNGTAGNQTFAISSGTSNCTESPTSAKADRMDKYIAVNKVALADDMARGQGETIQGLAQIMNCREPAKLGSALQSKFSTIFTSHDLEANELTDRIITVVGRNESLASACGVTISAL